MAPFEQVVDELLSRRGPDGVWKGGLSSSALAAAVAVRALKSVDPKAHAETILLGSDWLAANQNDDGGWGDTDRSLSNVSTTLLALGALEGDDRHSPCRQRARGYLTREFGSLTPDAIVHGILRRYGNDRTFSAPILAHAAVSGILGDSAWNHVPQLPFELAVCPRFLLKWLRLDVVSYAVPALIAIGYLRHSKGSRNLSPLNPIRNACIGPLMRRLARMQPENGGFLEATPLTGFVTMALAEAGFADHVVVRRGVAFLIDSMRENGGWPIDTNLSTWITSQALKAVPIGHLAVEERDRLRQWYEDQQFSAVHPFTGSAPGGWGWTPLPGSVPDADDTAGALIALKRLMAEGTPTDAVTNGLDWLMALQNGDGGIPTFCRGWGRLPFDRSCADITAHAVEAVAHWYDVLDERRRKACRRFVSNALAFLKATRSEDGSWVPLWFGNEHVPKQENPCYGTAMVVSALSDLGGSLKSLVDPQMLEQGTTWLWENQNDDGGWGGGKDVPSTREETALAIAALAPLGDDRRLSLAVDWLNTHWDTPPAPIGLYFSSLWYYEEDYPLVFAGRAWAAMDRLNRSAEGSAS